jgi:hypothetical protein
MVRLPESHLPLGRLAPCRQSLEQANTQYALKFHRSSTYGGKSPEKSP